MNKAEMKQTIVEAKQEKGLTWTEIAQATGLSPEYVCSACLGMNHLEKDQADAVAELLGLSDEVAHASDLSLVRNRRRLW